MTARKIISALLRLLFFGFYRGRGEKEPMTWKEIGFHFLIIFATIFIIYTTNAYLQCW